MYGVVLGRADTFPRDRRNKIEKDFILFIYKQRKKTNKTRNWIF